jgi:hypothetical protein
LPAGSELDFWIGLPERAEFASGHDLRCEKLVKQPEPAQFYRDPSLRPVRLAEKTFTSPYGLNVISKMNDPHIRAQPIVSSAG